MLELPLNKIPIELRKYFEPKRKYGAWIKRRTKIWQKPNCMPSAVKDDMTNDFEYVYFFVKSRKYWFEQQFEPQKECSIKRAFSINHLDIRKDRENKEYAISSEAQNETYKRMREKIKSGEVPKRNKWAVWTISTKPFPEAHFAVYPEKLIEPMIQAGCPKGGVVLDPFMGAGTTAVVAKKQGKKYLGIEIKQEYIDMAKRRIKAIPESLF